MPRCHANEGHAGISGAGFERLLAVSDFVIQHRLNHLFTITITSYGVGSIPSGGGGKLREAE